MVSIDDAQKVACAASNGHMTDDVRGPYDVILKTVKTSWNHDV